MFWSSGKYERWSSSTSSGSVGLGFDNRPVNVCVFALLSDGLLKIGIRYRFKFGKLAKRSFRFFESSIYASSSLSLWLCGELGVVTVLKSSDIYQSSDVRNTSILIKDAEACLANIGEFEAAKSKSCLLLPFGLYSPCRFHYTNDDESAKEMAFAFSDNTQNTELNSFGSMKPDLLEPSHLGIQPERPSWPEREQILRLGFERRVKGVGIPFSIKDY
ncbi:hypothetical protein PIB30_028954 [Stylosanthes scabra]|uniref:Uncharacterized protein n=1 Tax=Stylosanthes scabra TaxID=79078 RepID=A0ABU6TDA6_9FABA|nr:hypothetical protein [Stylosanthes scabra]